MLRAPIWIAPLLCAPLCARLHAQLVPAQTVPATTTRARTLDATRPCGLQKPASETQPVSPQSKSNPGFTTGDRPAVPGAATCTSTPASPNPEYATVSPLDMSAGDKASFYVHRILNFGSIAGPAAEASILMALPPKNYPHEWRDGAPAFGRNYGAVFGRQQTAEFSRFAVGLALREDPRYYPSPNRNITGRIFHALGFTFADRSDSGHTQAAFANFIGATAGGFVGDAYLPASYTDLRHASVRSGFQLATFAMHNLTDEFAPEFEKLANALKLHRHSGN